MGTEGPMDSLDWKSTGDSAKSDPDAGPVVKKGLSKKCNTFQTTIFLLVDPCLLTLQFMGHAFLVQLELG
ncbi:hypothetical protein CTI12_AA501550 [Artemisia annua]|uniref:Uncharacterized protein n=1 Tax=Artemisia annua TaxID=35608 RepID=A0A2U1LEZ2_ARTAN|nr:hypothetical protein CTI12_AA501550 [Artemisia annua]